MLSISHGTLGAFIAAKIGNPLIAAPLIIASHFACDYIPHWDVGQGLTKKKKSPSAAFYQELLFDLPLSLLLIYFFFQINHPFDYRIWLGWFLGLLPDFIEAPRNFLNWEPAFLKPINHFHQHFHHSIPDKFRGLVPQLLLILLLFLLR